MWPFSIIFPTVEVHVVFLCHLTQTVEMHVVTMWYADLFSLFMEVKED